MIIGLDELFSQLLAMHLRPTARRYDKSTRAIHDLTDLNLFWIKGARMALFVLVSAWLRVLD